MWSISALMDIKEGSLEPKLTKLLSGLKVGIKKMSKVFACLVNASLKSRMLIAQSRDDIVLLTVTT